MGLKDGVIWRYDAGGTGTPIHFSAPVSGRLALPDTGDATGTAAQIVIYVAPGANPAVPDLPADGWSLHAMTRTDWDALGAERKAQVYLLGTVSGPAALDSAAGAARTFTPVAQVGHRHRDTGRGGWPRPPGGGGGFAG